MARNPIQFQKGLSEVQFQKDYGTEKQCAAALTELRWPNGFVCAECGSKKAHALHCRPLMQCARCHTQTSLTAGTIFHKTRLPLTIWFRCIYLLTQSKNGVSAMELMRRLGIAYNSAWMMKHKLMQVMKERDGTKRLGDRVEMDDAYIGGERPRKKGKSGRGAEGKTPFIAAVQTNQSGHPGNMALFRVDGFSSVEVERFARQKLAPDADVVSDGLPCFAAVIEQGCSHSYKVTGSSRESAQDATFRWVNTALGNIKSALTGTYRQIAPKHVPRYLSEFQYRFNRRYDLSSMPTRLCHSAVRTPPMPYRLLVMAESSA